MIASQQEEGQAPQSNLTFPIASLATPSITPLLQGLAPAAQIQQPAAQPSSVCAGDARTSLLASLEGQQPPPQQPQPQPVLPSASPPAVPAMAPAAALPAPAALPLAAAVPAALPVAAAAAAPIGTPVLARAGGQPVAWNGPPQDTRGLTWAALAPAAAPSIATISDRRVQIPPLVVPEQPSLYRLCRQWVQNEPELALMPEATVPSQLPPLRSLSAAEEAVLAAPPPSEQPLLSTATQEPEPETLMTHHLVHWKAVRTHEARQAAVRQERYCARLQALVPGAMPTTVAGGGTTAVQAAAAAAATTPTTDAAVVLAPSETQPVQ